MERLDRIAVTGFKSIREMNLELRALNVLIGANGSGKSNFIAIFGLLNQIVEERLQVHVTKAGGADALLRFGQKHTSELGISLRFGSNGYSAKLAPSANGSLFFEEEDCSYKYGDGKQYDVRLGAGEKETGLIVEAKSPRAKIAKYVLSAMRGWKIYHFHDTSSSARVKQPGPINDDEVFRSDASNLAAFLLRLQANHPRHYERIVGTIRLVAPFFSDFVLRSTPGNKTLIQLEWRERDSDAYFNAHGLSDGTLRFICLAVLLLQPAPPSTILIDEPEIGLHPYAITVLASLLQAASRETQVIVSTQSVTLVNQLSPEDVIVVDREEEQSTFKRLSEQDLSGWLDDYGLGDLWEKNLLGGRPR